MQVSPFVTDCEEFDGLITITSCVANTADNYLEFTIRDAIELVDFNTEQYQINANQAVNLGYTNKTVENILVTTSTGEGYPTSFESVIGALDVGTLTPADLVVGADTALLVDVTTNKKIPKKGKLIIGVSKYWNEGDTVKIDYFSSVSCKDFTIGGSTVQIGTYSCSFLEGSRVEIVGGFKDSDIAANTQIKIRIVGFRSPIQRNVAFDGFEIYTTGEDEANVIEYMTATVMATEAGALTGAIFEVAPTQTENIGIVQEANNMRLKFSSPVPLTPNCRVSYWFPTDYYDAAEITSVRLGSLFGKRSQTYYPQGSGEAKTFVLDEENEEFKSITMQSCDSFQSQKPEVSYIFGLTHPQTAKESASIQAYIYDSLDQLVAFFDSGATFTTTTGVMEFVSASLDITTVYASAMITMKIRIRHSLIGIHEPSLTIELPSEMGVGDTCIVKTDDTPWSGSRTCDSIPNQNSVTIRKFVDKDVSGGTELPFTIGLFVLPGSPSGGKGEYHFTTYEEDFDHGGRFAVDITQAADLFTITSGGFEGSSVEADQTSALSKAELTISFTPTHIVPKYGIVHVEYPEDLVIEDPSLSQTLCNSWVSFPSTTPVCTIYTSNRTIIITKGFQAGEGGEAAVTEYSFKVPYVTMPPTVEETGNFKFWTYDLEYFMIDFLDSDSTVQMTVPAQFKSSGVLLDSYENSVKTLYTFTIVATSPIVAGNVFLVTFPEEMILPTRNVEYDCESPSTTYFTALSCKTFDPDPLQPDENKIVLIETTLRRTIPALETFQIGINGIMNPNTTKQSGTFHIQVYKTEAMEIIMNEDTQLMSIITSVPYSLPYDQANLTRTQTGAGLPTTYTLNMQLEHNIPKGGGLLVKYPPEVVVNDVITVSIDASSYRYFPKMNRPEIDYSARQILFVDQTFGQELVVDKDLDQALKVNIDGLSNPYNNEASSSFEIVTFSVEEGVLYYIDQVNDGLIVNSQCSYPCKGCLASNPTFCTSCFDNSEMKFLQENTCLEECSDGKYYDVNTKGCEPCDSTCLTCSGSATTCTTCGVDPYLLLNRDTRKCLTTCDEGYLDDPSQNLCLRCKAGCAACSLSTTNCTACEPNTGTAYFFDFDCLQGCPRDYSIPSGRKCLPCDATCKTCAETTSTCTSCESYMRYDPLNNDCLEACIPNEQIYDQQSGICQTCHENCVNCVQDVNTCTVCKDKFLLNTDSTCQYTCNNENQTAVDGVCKECEEPCAQCDGEVDKCKTCIDDFLLYKSTCVDHCPEKFEPNNATVNQCILVGLICPEGFSVNDIGEGCVPNEFECKEGYIINEKRTACIPGPGSPVPFPFIFLALCIMIVVAGSYMKEKNSTKVYTCLIFLIGSLELLEYFLIAVFAAMLEQTFAALLASLAVIALMGSNITFTGWYKKTTMADKAYAGWIRLYPKTQFFMPVLTCIFNFKMVRFVFSGFYGMDNCMAQFTEPMRNIHSQLKMLTYFHYVFVYAPIYLADFIIFSQIEWGHQVLVLAWETAILQTIIIILTQLEFRDPESLYQEGEGEYTVLKPRKNGQIAVMAAFDDDDMDEKNLIRYDKNDYEYEVQLRKRALTAILKQVGSNFLVSQKTGADIGGEISKVFTKFDKNQIKLRRAFSFETLQKSWQQTDGTRDESSQSDQKSIASDDSKYEIIKHRRFSFPFYGLEKDDVQDAYFTNQLNKLKKAFIEEKYRDNCYAEVKKVPKSNVHQRKKKMVNRRTQTYLRELLQLEEEPLQDSDMEIVMEDEAEIDEEYAQGLINGLIDGLSEVPDSTRKKKKKKREKMKGPNFELADIMGEFEIDDAGNYIILRGEQAELLDRRERPVNKRGYLVDKLGNIINQKKKIIFKKDDLDSDEEIPAQFGFEKRKQNLLSMSDDEKQFQVNTFGQGPGKEDRLESENEEDLVEQQFLQIKQGQASDSENSRSQIAEPLVSTKNFMIDEHGNIEDMIDVITKKAVPVPAKKKPQKPPPVKKFQPSDGMFFQSQVSEGERKDKLQKIAESISGFASQINSNKDLYDNRSNSIQYGRKEFYQQTQTQQEPSQGQVSQDNLMFLNDNFHKKNSTKEMNRQLQRPRIQSGDPRMKGLESIYMNKVGSQKNLGLKKPIQPPRKGFVEPGYQRQNMVAGTIDRIEQQQSVGNKTAMDGFYQKLDQ